MSNVKSGTLTVIDGSCNSIVKNIFVSKRPFKIAVMDNNTIYVACDRSKIISVIDCLTYQVSKICIPNDGNIEIDKISRRMFISNTSEIIVYDIVEKRIISIITGFISISTIKLSKDSSKLYVVDKLLSEFKIYSAVNYSFLSNIKNIGINPGYFLISQDENVAYISMDNNGIVKLNINEENLSTVMLPKGSIIAGMALKGDILYAANKGLNRIELIDIETCKAYEFILTSMDGPNRMCLTQDETKLIVANRNEGGNGFVDIIDTATNRLISRVLLDECNSQPYDVISVSLDLPKIVDVPLAITDLKSSRENLIIITKKVFACHKECINFPDISVKLPKYNNSAYVLDRILFRNGVIVKDSEVRTTIAQKPGYSKIQFLLRITYMIYYLDENNKSYEFQGFLENYEDIIVAIPRERDMYEFEIRVKTTTKFINTPSLIGNIVRFKVAMPLEVKIIGEDELSIKAFEESFKPFVGFSGSIFPEGTIFPNLNEFVTIKKEENTI